MWTVRLSAKSTHCPGASSDAAVRNIDRNSTTKSGLASSRNICPIETPAAARSVGGNFTPTQRMATRMPGTAMKASFACQPRPIADIATPSSPPITNPPGHHACTALRRAALSRG